MNIDLLKIEVYDQLFNQRLFLTKITQISSSKIVLSQVCIRLSLFNILHYINVIFLFIFNIIFSLYPFFCRPSYPSSYSSLNSNLIIKAPVQILSLAFFKKLSYLFSTNFWKQCLYLKSWTHSWSLLKVSFLSFKSFCTYTTLSKFCKVTASLLKRLSFSDKEMFSFGAINSSKWLQWFYGFAEYSWLIKFERQLMVLRTNDRF